MAKQGICLPESHNKYWFIKYSEKSCIEKKKVYVKFWPWGLKNKIVKYLLILSGNQFLIMGDLNTGDGPGHAI